MTDHRWRLGLFIMLGILLLLSVSLFKPAVGQAASLAPTKTITATLQPTLTPTLNATAQREFDQTTQLLTTSPYDIDCPARTPYRIDCYAMMLLDFWYRHPQTPLREQLIERLMATASYGHYQIQLSWLIDDWLNEQVVSAFQAAHGLPEGFEEQWKNRLRLIKTDLDNNDEPDYLIFMSFYPRDMDTFGFQGLYWLHRIRGRYQIELLDVMPSGPGGIDVKTIYALNADGYSDLAYSKIHCGASQCFDNLLIRTYRNGQWQDILFVDGGWDPNGIIIGPDISPFGHFLTEFANYQGSRYPVRHPS